MIPFPTLCAAALERALNSFLNHNHEALCYLPHLSGKLLQLNLQELASPLVLIFSEQAITILATHEISADCCVSLRLAILPKLRDQSQIIPLIRAGQLDINGDLSLLHHMVTLLTLCVWDPEEQLSNYIGDVLAHGLMRAVGRVAHRERQRSAQRRYWLREMLVEEWRLLPGRSESISFTHALEQLRYDVLQLESRLQKLLPSPQCPQASLTYDFK